MYAAECGAAGLSHGPGRAGLGLEGNAGRTAEKALCLSENQDVGPGGPLSRLGESGWNPPVEAEDLCATLVLGALKLFQAKAALSCSGTTFLSSNYKEASVGSD